jgi:hypothetical protein
MKKIKISHQKVIWIQLTRRQSDSPVSDNSHFTQNLVIRIANDADEPIMSDGKPDCYERLKLLTQSVNREIEFLEEIDPYLDADGPEDEGTDATDNETRESPPDNGKRDPERPWEEEIPFRVSNHRRQAFLRRWGFLLHLPHPTR